MKHLPVFLIITFFLFSCKQKTSSIELSSKDEIEVVKESPYPEALQKIFKTHGGLKVWREQKTLQYVIPKPDNPETHIIDLHSRKDRIETPNYDMGFDGNRPWILNKTKEYQGNVEFYHNLMFYFYAMPFVLADDGIYYGEAKPLEFEGKRYPGIRISYGADVGTSPKDEYFVHYDPETYQMQWLGYTVTYRTQEKSDNIKWIRYNDWGNYAGLNLPTSISWYNYEGMDIKDLRNTVPFEGILLSTESQPDGFYEKPEEAEFYSKP